MAQFKTCEEYVLGELFNVNNELEKAKTEIEFCYIENDQLRKELQFVSGLFWDDGKSLSCHLTKRETDNWKYDKLKDIMCRYGETK